MLKNMMSVVRNEEGQGMAEYGVILALVAVVAVAGFTLLGTNILAVINDIAGDLL